MTQLNEQYLRMQKLAGVITENEYKEKLEEGEAETAVNKAATVVPKLEKSSEMDKLADKVAKDPNLMKQLEKALAAGGIQLNEVELDNSDMKQLALNFAKKGETLKEEYRSPEEMSYDDKPGEENIVGLGMLGGVVGGTLGAALTSTIVAAIPVVGSLFAGPAVLGAVAGFALFVLAKKVYAKSKNN